MEVRAKKALGQHFLTDQRIAQAIVDALLLDWSEAMPASAGRPAPELSEKVGKGFKAAGGSGESYSPVLEVGPGMGVLTQYLLQREDIDLKLVEIDGESVEYLLTHFPGMQGRLLQADFLTLRLEKIFPERFAVIGNFPYNISSQIFFKILDYRERIPEVVCMIQKEVAERIAEGPGTKTYGILSVLLQAWYDIEYLFSVGSGCFAPPPKVESAVIRLTRNTRTDLGCDESLFKAVVKTAFGQRRKMMRNPLKPLIAAKAAREGWTDEEKAAFTANPVFERRPETLSVEDFIDLTNLLT
jgi:16S rRNA (adenine1518-N6/adenine1519-N6)-dimethyltransferase